jgi:hypothetical protein
LLASWEEKFEDAKKDEINMMTGKMNGQVEIEGSTTND